MHFLRLMLRQVRVPIHFIGCFDKKNLVIIDVEDVLKVGKMLFLRHMLKQVRDSKTTVL